MKCVILCGGKGVLEYKSNDYIPKILMPVFGDALILSLFKCLYFFGIKDLILCTSDDGSNIKSFLASVKNVNERSLLEQLNITYVNTGKNSLTGYRLAQAAPYIDDDFLLCYSDVLSDINISRMMMLHRHHSLTVTMAGAFIQSPLGVITHNDKIVQSLEIERRVSSPVKAGYFICKPKVFDSIDSQNSQCNFERDTLQSLINEHQVAYYEHKGYWQHIDTFKQAEALSTKKNRHRPILWDVVL